MQKTFWRIAVIIMSVTCYAVRTQAQEFTKHSIKIGAGFEMVDERNLTGEGFVTVLTYQRQLKDWLWFAPYAKHGTITTIGITCTPDAYYNMMTLGIGMNTAILKLFYVGLGGEINYLHGLERYESYTRDICLDICANAGFHIAPCEKRIAVNIIPLTLAFGTSELFSGGMRLEMEIKL